jgi:serine/threonine protein kinase
LATDTDTQLKTKDTLQKALGEDYVVALNLQRESWGVIWRYGGLDPEGAPLYRLEECRELLQGFFIARRSASPSSGASSMDPFNGIISTGIPRELKKSIVMFGYFVATRTVGRSDPFRHVTPFWAATAIRHPGIVEIYDFGFLPNGAAYIAMEMLDGESLSARLRRQGRLPAGATIEIGRQVAAALHAAHSKAITHRDLKPDNVFLISDPEIGERVKLLDFGIAKLITEDAGNRTRTGMVMGTPVYMSPEQCRGTAALDSRADLYSLGCMLYELLTGRPPFVAESAGDIIAHHLYFQPEPVRMHEASVPEPLEQLIMSLLAKDPAMRPASAADVRAIFDGWRTLASASSGGAMHATPVTAPMPATPPTLPTAPTAPAAPK